MHLCVEEEVESHGLVLLELRLAKVFNFRQVLLFDLFARGALLRELLLVSFLLRLSDSLQSGELLIV